MEYKTLWPSSYENWLADFLLIGRSVVQFLFISRRSTERIRSTATVYLIDQRNSTFLVLVLPCIWNIYRFRSGTEDLDSNLRHQLLRLWCLESYLGRTLKGWKQGSTSWQRTWTGRTTNQDCCKATENLRQVLKQKYFTLCWLYFSLIAGKLFPALVHTSRCNASTQSARSEGLYSV